MSNNVHLPLNTYFDGKPSVDDSERNATLTVITGQYH